MAKEKISVETAKVKTKGPDGTEVNAKAEFEYDFGANLAEAVKMFGEAVVFGRFKAKAVIEVQDVARNAMVAGKTPAEAAELAANHKLGETTSIAKDPVVAGLNALDKMSPEERKKFILALQEKSKSLGA